MAVLGASIPWVKSQFFDHNGEVAASARLYVYKAGTDLKATTWTDKDQTTENANPIILDSAGRASIFLDRTVAHKFVLTDETADPPQSPLWTKDKILSLPFYSVNNSVTRAGAVFLWNRSDNIQTLDAPDRPVILYNAYVGNATGTGDISIPAGTLDNRPLSVNGDGLILEWETDHASAIISARSEAFGTAVDAGTGAASTMTRARFFFYRSANTSVHVSTEVFQNTGAGVAQVAMGQQSITGLDLDATDYTVDMKMSGGTWTIRGARCYFAKAFGDWQAR